MSYKDLNMGTRYEFERILGRGGMGVVLRAKDTILNRPVAVKILSDELADVKEAQDIFMTEGRALASLKHPNLVSVFDVLEQESRVMMVLEYVEGDNLDDILRTKGSLDQETVIDVGMQLTLAIQYLHENGFIHRDLKPANVMMQPGGDVKLIDFGLARSLEVLAERGTRVRGSPAYMAPEQFTGDPLSGATDIYGLGVTLFELYAGRLPFIDGDNGFSHVHREPPKLADVAPEVVPGLSVLISRCLAKTPADRPSPAEVLSVLKQLSLGEQSTFDGVTNVLPVMTNGDLVFEENKNSDAKKGLLIGLVVALVLGASALVAVNWPSEPVIVEAADQREAVLAPVEDVKVEESVADTQNEVAEAQLAMVEGREALSTALELSKSATDVLADAVMRQKPEKEAPVVRRVEKPAKVKEPVPDEMPTEPVVVEPAKAEGKVEPELAENKPAVAPVSEPEPQFDIPIPALKPEVIQKKPAAKVEPKKTVTPAAKPKPAEKKVEEKETAEPLLSF